jgi:hypothetical protein
MIDQSATVCIRQVFCRAGEESIRDYHALRTLVVRFSSDHCLNGIISNPGSAGITLRLNRNPASRRSNNQVNSMVWGWSLLGVIPKGLEHVYQKKLELGSCQPFPFRVDQSVFLVFKQTMKALESFEGLCILLLNAPPPSMGLILFTCIRNLLAKQPNLALLGLPPVQYLNGP